MDSGVFELVFILVVKNHAVVVNEVQDARFPEGTRQELNNEIVFPFLTKPISTSSASCSAEGFGFLGSSSFFFPKSHSSINHYTLITIQIILDI